MFDISCISFSWCLLFRERAATEQNVVPAAGRVERHTIKYHFLQRGEGELCRGGLPIIYSHI